MRDDLTDSVTSGGDPAPLGGRGAKARGSGAPEAAARFGDGSPSASATAGPAAHGVRPGIGVLLTALGLAIAVFGLFAHAVVGGGRLVELDTDVARWVARDMPSWAEWLARPFTWLGGFVGVTLVVACAAIVLLRSRQRAAALLLIAVAVTAQPLITVTKQGYERARPEAGSAIDLPSSFAFPSGHATTGIAVFGLLGILAARRARAQRTARLAIAGGFGLGVTIGASRVVLNVHYVSDVLAGYALGAAWLCVFLLAYHSVRR